MNDDSLESYFIPAKPEILKKIQDIMSVKEPNLFEVASLIAVDVGLSAEVLKTINSPFYGMCRTICDIKQTVLLLV
ncbi:MAG: HDOD domain-containing protein [Psychrosphaera sp.]|nr:HDOD domain-containing protein [Psychrosphaera sp.]